MKRTIATEVVNQGINVVYSVIFLTPVVIFWMDHYQTTYFMSVLGASLLMFILPNKVYEYVQLSNSKKFYRVLGIPCFQRYTQQGLFAQKLINYINGNQTNSPTPRNVSQLKSQIRNFESFHYVCFIFFTLTNVYALYHGEVFLSLIIFLTNVLYNIIPILIQQYNRIRLNTMIKYGDKF